MGGSVPAVYFVDEANGEIYMEWIEGQTVREVLDEVLGGRGRPSTSTSCGDALRALMSRIGTTVAQMHLADVVHGDLTTSNIMLRPTSTSPPTTAENYLDGQVVLIDFGLGSVSSSDEDMAVDLYVLERAFVSTHPRAEDMFTELLRGYETSMGKKGHQVMRRLAEVRMRGRKRSMIG